MKEALGDRMKSLYENRYRISMPRRSYTIIRVDGKAFHTYTKGLDRPYDTDFMDDMDATAVYLCANIMGAKLAYIQSDEISIVLTDFDNIGTEAWFDNNIQKMVSVSSSMATSEFNKLRLIRFAVSNSQQIGSNPDSLVWADDYMHSDQIAMFKMAEFDSRVFQIPQRVEVENYLIWRQQDATRNSIQSTAQAYFSTKQCHGKGGNELQEMLFSEHGTNWNDYPEGFKRGRIVTKSKVEGERTRPIILPAPIFTQDRDFLSNLIPEN